MAISAVFTGCASEKPVSGSDDLEKDSFIMALPEDAQNLDPQNNNSLNSMRIVVNINETLTKIDDNGKVVPSLAEDWEVSEDGLEYIFHIKKGVKFHNGEELKADDVVFTFERAMASPFAGAVFGPVESAEKIDDYSVKVKLKYQYVPFLTALTAPVSSIVNKEAVESKGDDYGRNPVGTGAYEFVNWASGSQIVLKAFEDYHLGPAPIKNVTYKIITDPSTAVVALQSGEVDAVINVPAIDIQSINNDPNLTLYETPSALFEYLGMNTSQAPFDNVKVRQAIAYALDKEGILMGVAEGTGVLANNQLIDSIFGYTDEIKAYPYDVEKAKSLLAEAGYEDGFNAEIITVEGDRKKIAQIVQENLRQIGITCEISILENVAYLDKAKKGEFDMFVTGWNTPAPDADLGLYFSYNSSMINAMNYTRYFNEEMDDLLIRGRTTPDESERLIIYKQALELLHSDVPNVPIYYTKTNIAVNKDIKGVKAVPTSEYRIYNFSW
jgi:peptide/nickel transport system substrate-binding protein